MKNSAPLKRIVLARRIAALFLIGSMIAPTANAAVYYWDTNGTTAGFGTASGTWGTDAFWSTSTVGTTATTNPVTSTGDTINFGTLTDGLGAGTISIPGAVSSGNITYGAASGGITLTGGTITLPATTIITVLNTSDTIGSGLAGAATMLRKYGNGTLVLTGDNTYAGQTSIERGTLVLDKSGGSASISDSSTLLFNGNTDGGNFVLKGAASGTSTETVGGFTVGNNVTMARITIDPNGGDSSTLVLGNAWSIGTNTSILFDYSAAGTGSRQIVTAGATTGTAPNATGTVDLAGNFLYGRILVKDTTGIGYAMRAPGANQPIVRYDDTTGTSVSSTNLTSSTGTTNFTTLGSTYSSGVLDLTSSTSRFANTLTIDTSNIGGVINLGTGSVLINSRGVLFKGPNDVTINGGLLGSNNNNTDFSIHTVGTGTVTINNILSGITKDGTGTLVVAGASTFSNSMAVNEGILRLGSAGDTTSSPLGSPTVSTVRVGLGGALDLNGYSLYAGGATTKGLWLSGTGVSGSGALMNSGAAATFPGQVTLRSSASIIANNGSITLSNTGNIAENNSVAIGIPLNLTLGGSAAGSSIAGSITVSGLNLTKIGTGSWTLNGTAHSYSGATTVSQGKLTISATATNGINSSSGVFIGAGNFNYNAPTSLTKPVTFTATGGTLSGNGTIGAILSVPSGNTIAPGNSPGILTFNAGLTMAAGANIQWELFSDTTSGAGTNFDQITISGGALNLAAGVNFVPTFDGLSYTGPTANAFWGTTQTWAGVFTLTGGTNVGASVLTIDNSAWASLGSFATQLNGSNIDLVWTATAIPEPGTLVFGGLTVLGFAAHRLRRRRHQASSAGLSSSCAK